MADQGISPSAAITSGWARAPATARECSHNDAARKPLVMYIRSEGGPRPLAGQRVHVSKTAPRSPLQLRLDQLREPLGLRLRLRKHPEPLARAEQVPQPTSLAPLAPSLHWPPRGHLIHQWTGI